LTHQRVALSTFNKRIKDQLEKLKKITNKLEKKSIKNKKCVDNWTKRVSEKSITSFRSYFSLSVDIASSMQSFCKKFEVKIFIKDKEKIKRIITTTTKNINAILKSFAYYFFLNSTNNLDSILKNNLYLLRICFRF